MKKQVQIASEPKNSNLASTLAHETRKNMKKYFFMLVAMFCFLVNVEAQNGAFRTQQNVCIEGERISFFNDATFKLYLGGKVVGTGFYVYSERQRTITAKFVNHNMVSLEFFFTGVVVTSGTLEQIIYEDVIIYRRCRN